MLFTFIYLYLLLSSSIVNAQIEDPPPLDPPRRRLSWPGQSCPNPPASLLSRDISTSGNDPDILAIKNLEARQTRRRPPSFCRIEQSPENGIECARADIEIGAGTYGIVTPRGRQIDVRMDALRFNPGSQERRVYTHVRNNAQVPCTFEFSTPVVVGGTQHGPGQQHLEPGEECEIQGLVVPTSSSNPNNRFIGVVVRLLGYGG
ncbi:hypothetical protein B0J12DRAFT_416420 [Macrophomina phaseolina]|uniref:Uncharacterized protein n=1 Tax=Macrophomina phaseolina TaxID=35725 RepID=A0ABQ8FSL2_9PEZI|nr:hypothetical protein B0J12DRAFT_416420 [Macrophomina phaseolina]